MSQILESIDVDVPVRTAYDQWTQFETFPQFMEGVERVEQLTDTTLRWTAEVAGVEKSWEAEITEQTPDQRIAWRATSGAENAGVVTFHRLDDRRSRVTLQLDVEPEGLVESAGDALGFVQRRATATSNGSRRSSRSAAPRRAPGAARSNRTTSPADPARSGHVARTRDMRWSRETRATRTNPTLGRPRRPGVEPCRCDSCTTGGPGVTFHLRRPATTPGHRRPHPDREVRL